MLRLHREVSKEETSSFEQDAVRRSTDRRGMMLNCFMGLFVVFTLCGFCFGDRQGEGIDLLGYGIHVGVEDGGAIESFVKEEELPFA